MKVLSRSNVCLYKTADDVVSNLDTGILKPNILAVE